MTFAARIMSMKTIIGLVTFLLMGLVLDKVKKIHYVLAAACIVQAMGSLMLAFLDMPEESHPIGNTVCLTDAFQLADLRSWTNDAHCEIVDPTFVEFDDCIHKHGVAFLRLDAPHCYQVLGVVAE